MARDVKADLRSFLRANFDATNVSVAFTPADDIVFAEYNLGHSYPEVAIVSEDHVVPRGGDTQFTAMAGDGSGPIQEPYALVTVDCWGGTVETTANQDAGVHPDVTANELAREVSRVIRQNPTGITGYEWANADPPTEANDTEGDGNTEYRRVVTVRMGYTLD